MKRFTLLFVVLFININDIIAQDLNSQNTILEISYFNYKASNFDLFNAKNITELKEKKFTKSFSKDIFENIDTKNYTLNKKLITSRYYKGKYYESSSDYLYSKNYKTLKKRVYKDRKLDEVVAFKFDNKKRLIEVITTFKKAGTQSIKRIEYDDKNKSIKKYAINSKGEKKEFLFFKTDNEGRVISKTKKGSSFTPYDKHRNYNYTSKTIISVSKNETKEGIKQTERQTESVYKYNDKGLIISDKGNLTKSDYTHEHHDIYEYVYDEFGNWIIKFKFSTIYGYDDLYSENYKGIRDVVVRQIIYKKGIITGSTDINSSRVQNYLNAVVVSNPFKTRKPPKQGVYWMKNSERGVKVYDHGKYIAKQTNLLLILGNDFYVNDSINKTLYKLTNFINKPIQEKFYKADVFSKNDEVVWYRSNDKAIKSYKNGQQLIYKLNYFNIFENQFFINDSTTNNFYQLEDFGNKKIKEAFYKAKKIGKQDDVMWIKLKNGNYTLVKNGVNITTKIKMVYAKNSSNVLVKVNGISKYVMLDVKNAKANHFNVAVDYSAYIKNYPNETKMDIIPNGFYWKKNIKEQFYIYKNGKIDSSKLRVLGFYSGQFVYDVDHNFSYLLEDFDTKKVNQFHLIKMLVGNAFFYKTSSNKIGLFKNGLMIEFSKTEYTKNKIDVRVYDDNNKDVYILKNYKNLKIQTLGIVINNKDYTE
jgi:ribosomal protein S8E